IQGTGKPGTWGRIATRIVRHPVPTLVTGLVDLGGLAFAVLGYTASRFGGRTTPPAPSDPAPGPAPPTPPLPQSSANPTSLIFRFADPVWEHPGALATGTEKLKSNALFTTVSGPLNPAGAPMPPALYASLHAKLGPASALPPVPPAGTGVPLPVYELYRATGNYVSPDG